jgi:hypothetical protein
MSAPDYAQYRPQDSSCAHAGVHKCENGVGTRQLDLRRGLLLSTWAHRTPAGITFDGHELRLLSLADRAAGLQLLRFSIDRDDVDVMLEASFAMAGLGMEPMRLEHDLGVWRLEGTGKGVQATGDEAFLRDCVRRCS